jgi:general secretion pathway protein C
VIKAIAIFIIFALLTYFFQQSLICWINTNVASQKLARQATTSKNNRHPRSNFDKRDYQGVSLEPLFGKLTEVTPAPTPAPKKVSETNLRLIGTFVSPLMPGVAIIENTKISTQDAFEVGNIVFEVGTLESVEHNQITIRKDGQLEVLELEDGKQSNGSSNVQTSTAESIEVKEAELDQALENLPMLLTQARAVPYFEQGKAVGLRLFAIKSESLFEKVGLRNGDILKTINGENLGDFSKALTLFERLKRERSIKLELVRNRQPITYNYQIR